MQRITITIDDDLLTEVDQLVAERGYQNRSEAIRDLARGGLAQAAQDAGNGRDCVGALVYVYDHSARRLADRLINSFHEHHDIALATMHVHLDHDTCMEVAVLRGRNSEVQHFADHLIAERGVRHGRIYMVPVEIDHEAHSHAGKSARRHSHAHVHSKR